MVLKSGSHRESYAEIRRSHPSIVRERNLAAIAVPASQRTQGCRLLAHGSGDRLHSDETNVRASRQGARRFGANLDIPSNGV